MFARSKSQTFCNFKCIRCKILPLFFVNTVDVAFFLLAGQMMNYFQIHVSQITCHFTRPQKFYDTTNIHVYSSIRAFLQIQNDCNSLDLSCQNLVWVKKESFLSSQIRFVCFFMSQDILNAVKSFPLEITCSTGVSHFNGHS